MKILFISFLSLITFSFLSSQELAVIEVEKAKEDISFLVQKLKNVHYDPYSTISEQKFNESVENILDSWEGSDQISMKSFLSSSIKIASLASGGNTQVEWQNSSLFPELGSYGFIPFKVKKLDGKYKCTYSLDKEIRKGAEIKSINGKSIVEIYKDLLTYSGGNNEFKLDFAEDFLPLYLFLNGIGAPYILELNNDEIGYIPNGLNLVDVSILLTSDIPKSQYDFRILDQTIAYINFNSASSLDSFDLFLQSSFKEIQNNDIDKLIIDIRRNSGVNSKCFDMIIPYISKSKYRQNTGRIWKVSDEMKERMKDSVYIEAFGKKFTSKYISSETGTLLKHLSKKKIKPIKEELLFEGQSCVLIGPGTLSTASAFADAVKSYQLSILLGKPTLVPSNYFGELLEFKMPNSGTVFYVSSTMEIGAIGDMENSRVITPNIPAKGDALIEAMKWLKGN